MDLCADELGHVIKHKPISLLKAVFNRMALTFSPTLNIDYLKLFIAFTAKFKQDILQLDIKATYLNVDLDKDVYSKILPEILTL